MALTIENSPLYQDIADVFKPYEKDIYKPYFDVEVKVHTEEKDLDVTDNVTLSELYIIRDYVNNISDYIEAQIVFPFGTFVYDVYPYLDNVEITLITTKQRYKGKTPHKEKERYKAVYLLDKNPDIPSTINLNKSDLNQYSPISIRFQLLDRATETLRIKTTIGNYDPVVNANSDMSIKAFLKSVISEEANKILIENKPALDAIYIEEPNNKEPLKSITIPSYTRIVELADYIQTKNVGIYNAGVGCYIQKVALDHYTYKKGFFVYSLYNGKKYEKEEQKTIFYNPITSSMSIKEKTYHYEDKILKIVPYTITNIKDNKEALVMSYGSGIRVSNANSMMKKPVEMKEEGPSFKKDRLVTEISFKDRKDNLNFARNYSTTSNQFHLVSNVLKDQGKYVTIEVSHLDHDFIYPGAACKIMYEDNNAKVKELFGVIHNVTIKYSNDELNLPVKATMKATPLYSKAILNVFVLQI